LKGDLVLTYCSDTCPLALHVSKLAYIRIIRSLFSEHKLTFTFAICHRPSVIRRL